jgi:hypothetical protein
MIHDTEGSWLTWMSRAKSSGKSGVSPRPTSSIPVMENGSAKALK